MTAMIWLNDKSNDDLGFIVTGQSQRPGLPGTVDRALTIPRRHGQYDFGADLGARQFVLACAFLAREALELQQRVSTLARFLVDSYGKPRELQLRFRERPDQYFNVRFVGSFDIDRIIGTGVFSLPLTAFDPFAYADQEKIYEDVISAFPYAVHVDSTGNVRTSPVIALTNEGATTITHFRIANEYRLEE